MILIIINHNIYEVSKFVKNHPGEGILNEYLRNYHNKNATEEFNRFHFTNDADELLLKSKNDNTSGIYFVGPSFWKKKIPNYYHFFSNPVKDAPEFFSNCKNMTFIITNKSENSLFLFYKKEEKIESLEIIYNEQKKEWSIKYENTLYHDTQFDNVIKIVMFENFYTAISNKK